MSEDKCSCRKPKPGMMLAAQKKYNLDLSKSYLVGDAISDIQASVAANTTPIFVLSGRGNPTDLSTVYGPIKVLDHIGDAANYICGDLR